MRKALVLTLLTAVVLAGCAADGQESTPPSPEAPSGNITPPPVSNAQFELSAISIVAKGDPNRTALYEDDQGALVRYTVRQPPDAARETAFVTYILNGRILDVQQLTLEPGKEKSYERSVSGLRDNRTIKVEVRAGSAVQRAEATVQDWPRAGEDALELGPLSIRADYGLLQQDSRALVNLTLVNDGPEQRFRDFRVKMLCLAQNGTIVETSSVRIEPPTPGNSTGVDVSVQDCSHARYGLEFKATGDNGVPIFGRLLLVEEGWRPPTPASTQA